MKKSVKFAVTAAAVVLIVGVLAVAMLLQNGPQANTPPASGGSQSVGTGEPLRVCVDLLVGGFSLSESQRKQEAEKLISGIFSDMDLYGGPEDIEYEVIPESGAARSTALTRIRTEVMSGGGPDVFICNCANPSVAYGDEGQMLFPLPEKSMEAGLFLPLDEYIEKAQYMEWEKLSQPVMEAGRTDEGQMLLPLSYSFPTTVFRAEDVSLPDAGTTWADVVSGENPVLSATARWVYDTSLFPIFPMASNTYSGLPWGKLADYKTDSLAISQEELVQDMVDIVSLRSEKIKSPAHFYDMCPIISFSSLNPLNMEKSRGISRNEDLTFVPVYQKEGGAAACIRAFAGINRNTKRPEDAFFLLDLFLSESTQEYANIYNAFFWGTSGLPVLNEYDRLKRYFDYENKENYTNFCAAQKQISSARFSTGLDQILWDAVTDCTAVSPENTQKIEEIVAEAYREMELMLDES